jgi:hypothetical protein
MRGFLGWDLARLYFDVYTPDDRSLWGGVAQDELCVGWSGSTKCITGGACQRY